MLECIRQYNYSSFLVFSFVEWVSTQLSLECSTKSWKIEDYFCFLTNKVSRRKVSAMEKTCPSYVLSEISSPSASTERRVRWSIVVALLYRFIYTTCTNHHIMESSSIYCNNSIWSINRKLKFCLANKILQALEIATSIEFDSIWNHSNGSNFEI